MTDMTITGSDALSTYIKEKMKDKRKELQGHIAITHAMPCLLYTSPSPRDRTRSRMPSSA